MSKFTNSPLVEYTHISPNRTSPRKYNYIGRIIVHHMAGCLTLKQFDNIVSNPNRKMSSNYAIDKDAHVGMFCEEKDRSWCSSSGAEYADGAGISIEVSNSSTGGNWPVSDKVYNKLIDLCADICIRNNIKELTYTGDKNGSLVFHRFFAATLCLPTDTELLTPHGWIKLKNVKICDTIATYNKETNRIVFDKVQNKVPEYHDTVYCVGGLKATKTHNVIAVDGSGKPQFVPFSEVIDNRNYYGYLYTDDLNINNISIRKYNPEEKSQEFVDTEVSCVTVKSGYIVIRQDGLITIVGNCPGPYLFERANDICEKVNKKITEYNLQKKAEELANDNNTKNETPKTDDKKPNTTSIKKDDLVKVASNAVYYTGKKMPSWVKSQNWYVASVSGDRVVLGKNEKKDRDIQSPVNTKYLTVVKSNTPANDTTEKSFTFTVKSTQYIYDTYASNRKVVSTIKPGVYTITDTEVVSGVKFGKLKSGAGWIQLSGSTTEPKELKVGSLVKLAANATYYTGAVIPSWVKSQNWFVSAISGNRIVLGKNEKKDRDIQSPVHKKYITVIR